MLQSRQQVTMALARPVGLGRPGGCTRRHGTRGGHKRYDQPSAGYSVVSRRSDAPGCLFWGHRPQGGPSSEGLWWTTP